MTSVWFGTITLSSLEKAAMSDAALLSTFSGLKASVRMSPMWMSWVNEETRMKWFFALRAMMRGGVD